MKIKLSILLTILLISTNLFAREKYDPTFDIDGILKANPIDNTTARGLPGEIAALPDGKYLIGGTALNTASNHLEMVVQKLNPNGSPDFTFGGGDGVFTFLFDPQFNNEAFGMVVQADGKIILAGYTLENTYRRETLIRVNSDGTLDQTFGDNGVVRTPLPQQSQIETNSEFSDVEVLPTGRIIAAGNVQVGNNNTSPCLDSGGRCSLLSIYESNGTQVSRNLFDLLEDASDREIISDIDIQADGKIAAAVSSSLNDVFTVARFNADGTRDATFGSNGISQVTDFFGSTLNNIYGVAVQPDGKIVASGRIPSPSGIITARFNTDGSLDNSYGIGGLTNSTVDLGGRSIAGADVKIQPDGKILTVGSGVIIRLHPNGSPDLTFGVKGIVDIRYNLIPIKPVDMKLQPNGQIVFVARTTLLSPGQGAVDEWVVGRLTNGNRSFNFDGDTKTDISIFRPNVGEWWYLRSSDLDNR